MLILYDSFCVIALPIFAIWLCAIHLCFSNRSEKGYINLEENNLSVVIVLLAFFFIDLSSKIFLTEQKQLLGSESYYKLNLRHDRS